MREQRKRCAWAGNDPLMQRYHDREWGVPLHDDRKLFELLTLEGAQAGLSWSTVLGKREAYRRAFDGFDPAIVAGYGKAKVRSLLSDRGIVRNRLKIKSAVSNAAAFLRVREEFGSFDAYIWRFVGGKPVVNRRTGAGQVPPATPLSESISRDLKARGFRFVGSTICYAFMQASGIVNDHLVGCFRHGELSAQRVRE
ncbi:MAG TPA: DNA-3-methyladenine glycosylase I [Bacteroidota bacterium]|nr:DNA-3-methyladenine glycosylase I [Bacteroidota bacterium]